MSKVSYRLRCKYDVMYRGWRFGQRQGRDGEPFGRIPQVDQSNGNMVRSYVCRWSDCRDGPQGQSYGRGVND